MIHARTKRQSATHGRLQKLLVYPPQAPLIVSRALAELSEGERRAIELALYGGMTHSEIARVLGEESGIIRTRIPSGMQKLKTVLEPLSTDVLA